MNLDIFKFAIWYYFLFAKILTFINFNIYDIFRKRKWKNKPCSSFFQEKNWANIFILKIYVFILNNILNLQNRTNPLNEWLAFELQEIYFLIQIFIHKHWNFCFKFQRNFFNKLVNIFNVLFSLKVYNLK